MRIVNLRVEERGQFTRAAATLTWENSHLPQQDLYIEVPTTYAEGFACNPDAFLIACGIPAMHYGEQRIFVEGAICPTLKDGLQTAFGWLHHWFGVGNPYIAIEGDVRTAPDALPTARTASFFTGGVDSWANLLLNHATYPSTHPGFIRDCFLAYGLQRVKRSSFERAVEEFQSLEAEAQVRFIPVYTNIYEHLIDGDRDYAFWKRAYNGPALAAIAHTFANRYTSISIASGNDIPNVVPLGTHPVLDPYFSSYNLRISHDGITDSRLAKTQRIAQSALALRNLRVCDMPNIPPNRQNCGSCEKCVRTTTTLEALGALQRTQAFPYQTLSRQVLAKSCHIKHSGIAAIYHDLIPLLNAQGRSDLSEVIQTKIHRYHLEAFDQKYLNGFCFQSLRQLKALLNREPTPNPLSAGVQDPG